jgi:plastocyanin
MKIDRCLATRCSLLLLPFVVLATYATAASKSSKYSCSEPNPAQLCNSSNTCGSASTPCTVDVKRTANGASSTPSILNAKSNALFCVKAGTTVSWISTGKDIGFVVDVGPSSPFEPPGAIIGGTDRSVAVVAKKAGCYKYSAGACMSGAIYGMCGTADAELIITGGGN